MNKSLLIRIILVLALFIFSFSACEDSEEDESSSSDLEVPNDDDDDNDNNDDNDDDDNNDDNDDVDEGFFDDFESYTVGNAPEGRWSIIGLEGNAGIEVIDLNSKEGVGQAVKFIDPDLSSAGALMTEIPESLSQGVFRIGWDWYWLGGQGMGLNVYGAQMSRIAQIDLWEGRVEAARTDGGYEICADPVGYDTWIHLELLVDVPNEEISLSIDQASTPCHQIAFINEEENVPEGFLYNMYVDAEASTYLDNVSLESMGKDDFGVKR